MNKELIDKIKSFYEDGQKEEALQTLIDKLKEESDLENDVSNKIIDLATNWIDYEPTN